MEPKPHNLPTAQDVERGHEIRDARPGPLLIFVIVFLICLVLVQWVGLMCLDYLREKQQADDQRRHVPNVMAQFGTIPPAPGVQPEPARPQLPAEELAQVREREAELLGKKAHGWVDANHQFVRVPLEEAIDIAVQDGLPEKLAATQPSAPPFMPPASARHGPEGVP
jgi:hypothetical protein